MMSLLLNVGNVKFKSIHKVSNVFKHNYEHFILLNVSKDIVYLSEIIYEQKKSTYKILAISIEQRQYDDDLFYQEVLYHFCRDRNLKQLPVFISLDNTLLKVKQFNFPQMPFKDIQKAIDWELNDWKRDYVYNYSIENTDIDNQITVFLLEKSYINDWWQIIKEQNLQLAYIFYANDTVVNESDIKIVIDDDELFSIVKEDELHKIYNALYVLANHKEIILNKDFCHLTYLNWRNTSIAIILFLLVISSIVIGNSAYTYFNLKEQQEILSEQLYLKQADKDLINELKQQENTIKRKQNVLKTIYKKDVKFYPLMVNLGTNTLADVKLMNVDVKDNKIILSGKFKNYAAISSYKTQLEQIKFIKNIKINDTKLNEADNLIDFSFYFDEVN